jgi:NitT/TauT family transport system substrate-binding protein
MVSFKQSIYALAVVCAAGLAALGAPLPAAADDALTVVTGAQPTAFYQALDDVAIRGGFYKAEHLDVTYNYAGNPTIASQLLASGKGDIGAQNLDPLITGYEKGVRLQVFFMRDSKNTYALGVLDDSPIKTLADFKGTLLGEYSPASTGEVYVNSMLVNAGLKLDDFSYIPIGNGAQAIEAMTSHKVAGAAFPYLELLIYQINANQKYRFFFNPLLENVADTGYTATPETIAQKGDILKRFSRAVAKAAILLKVNPQLAARYYLEEAGLKVTDDAIAKETQLLELAQDLLPGANPLSKRIGDVPMAGLDALSKVMFDNGRTKVLVPAAAVATDQFITYANDFDHRAFVAQAKAMR